MPTYDYECKSCGYSFEVFQSMKDDPLTECPECGKTVRRLINGGSGIIFKGSGFYVTDNGGKSKPSSPAASKTAAAAPCASPSCDSCPKAESAPKEKALG